MTDTLIFYKVPDNKPDYQVNMPLLGPQAPDIQSWPLFMKQKERDTKNSFNIM